MGERSESQTVGINKGINDPRRLGKDGGQGCGWSLEYGVRFLSSWAYIMSLFYDRSMQRVDSLDTAEVVRGIR